MTLNHKPLEDYFRRINTQKDFTMFDYLKAHFSHLFASSPTPEPVPEEPPKLQDFYCIEMFTSGYTNSCEEIPDKYTAIKGDHVDGQDPTWMHLVDKFADMLSYHYGYNIKEQIYYAVKFPLNYIDADGVESPGYGRELNDDKLQLLLLTHPELYSSNSPYFDGKEV